MKKIMSILLTVVICFSPLNFFSEKVYANAKSKKANITLSGDYSTSFGVQNNELEEINIFTKDELLNMDNSSEPQLAKKIKINNNTKEIKTFEEKKTFSGTAEVGTKISYKMYIPNGEGKYKLLVKEDKINKDKKIIDKEIIVGNSKIFSINVDFELGKSILVISGEKDSKKVNYVVEIERIDSEIRDMITEYLNSGF